MFEVDLATRASRLPPGSDKLDDGMDVGCNPKLFDKAETFKTKTIARLQRNWRLESLRNEIDGTR